MSTDVHTKKLAQDAYTFYHRDGLIDIFLGLTILAFGISLVTDNVGMVASWAWMPALLMKSAKERITIPRIGHSAFDAERKAGISYIGVILFFVLTLTLVVGVIFCLRYEALPTEVHLWLRKYLALGIGVVCAVCAGIGALLSRITRLYGYALLILAAFGGGYLFNIPATWYVILLGGAVLLWGIVLLLRLLHDYPLPSKEITDVN